MCCTNGLHLAMVKIQIKNQKVCLPEIENSGVELYIKREDQIHPYISGNKYRKLKYNIFEAEKLNYKSLLTFGGAYSNHISAVAYVGKEFGFQTIGIIRGEELGYDLSKTLATNPTLAQAAKDGMQFKFVSRSDYKNKTSSDFKAKLVEKFGRCYVIPEGGTNKFAVKGCTEILTKFDHKFDVVCTSVGTGGTIAGIINSLENHQKAIGFSALKGDFLLQEIKPYTIPNKNWSLNLDYHFGGYAKISKELIDFINRFKEETQIPLDPVYTGKMVYGIVDLICNGYFKKGTKILAIHTGGLQGIAGMNSKLKKKGLPQIKI